MSKIIVNILSKQTIPVYLFIREKILIGKGDTLLFIETKWTQSNKIKDNILNALGYDSVNVDSILLENEESYPEIKRTLTEKLATDKEYIVNLTGGTKFISSATQEAFNAYNSSFYYIPYPKNVILDYGGNSIDISTKIDINTYFALCGLKISSKKNPIKTKESTTKIYKKFIEGKITGLGEFLEKMRIWRSNNNRRKLQFNEIANYELPNNPTSKQLKLLPVENLSSMLEALSFISTEYNILSKAEIEYITGGWFEEFVYWLIKDNIKCDDICLGVNIKVEGSQDLDVVFTYGNKLFIIECKTGIENKNAKLTEILNKAAAIRDSKIKTLSASSYLFNCSRYGNDEKDTALIKRYTELMDVKYYSFEDIENNTKAIFDEICSKAHAIN